MRFNSSNQNWVYIALESPVWILIIMTLSQLDFFKVLVFGKVCFNLIKLLSLLLYLFFLSSIIFYFFRFFVSFVFIGVRKIPPKENYPPVRVRVWVSFRVKVRIGGEIFLGDNCPRTVFTGGKKGDFLHANEILGFIYLVYVQSCTLLLILSELNEVS